MVSILGKVKGTGKDPVIYRSVLGNKELSKVIRIKVDSLIYEGRKPCTSEAGVLAGK